MKYRSMISRMVSILLTVAILISCAPDITLSMSAYSNGITSTVTTVIPERNITLNYPDYIGDTYTEADLMFPETVDVQATDGSTTSAAVTWDYSGLDLSTLGTYTLTGQVANTSLTVAQVIHVVPYQNLMPEASFEEDELTNWQNTRTTISRDSTYVRDGARSLKLTVGALSNQAATWFQALYSRKEEILGEHVMTVGAGRYYYGSWALGTESSQDCSVQMIFRYNTIDNEGKSAFSKVAPDVPLSGIAFQQCGNIVEIPDNVNWARLEACLTGTYEKFLDSTFYLDQMELVPINVESPVSTQIMDFAKPAIIHTYPGTPFADLKLPSTLQVLLQSGEKVDLAVEWNDNQYQVSQIGAQTITGTFLLGDRYFNFKNYIPSVTVVLHNPAETLRQTIYISTSGSEDNDGLSPESPKQDASKLTEYLAQGYNVRLKRGDTWYLPQGQLQFHNILGTEDAPLVLSAYGEGSELPTLAFMMKIENNAWTLVDAEKHIYKADVSTLSSRNGLCVYRTLVNEEPYYRRDIATYSALGTEQFCEYDGMLYICTDGEQPTDVEVTPYNSVYNRFHLQNVSYLTIEQLHYKGSSDLRQRQSRAAVSGPHKA